LIAITINTTLLLVLTIYYSELTEELNCCRSLNAQLKQKIRDISGRSSNDSKEFLDTFEEVMKDEMMAMKYAFETKLKFAKDAADLLSKKHQELISRMTLNPTEPLQSIKI